MCIRDSARTPQDARAHPKSGDLRRQLGSRRTLRDRRGRRSVCEPTRLGLHVVYKGCHNRRIRRFRGYPPDCILPKNNVRAGKIAQSPERLTLPAAFDRDHPRGSPFVEFGRHWLVLDQAEGDVDAMSESKDRLLETIRDGIIGQNEVCLLYTSDAADE